MRSYPCPESRRSRVQLFLDTDGKHTLGMATRADTRPSDEVLSGGRRPVLGDLAALPHLLELQSLTLPTTPGVASAYSPRTLQSSLCIPKAHWTVSCSWRTPVHADP